MANGLTVENPKASLKPWLVAGAEQHCGATGRGECIVFTVKPGVTVSNNVAYVSGAAPVNVASILVNGARLSADVVNAKQLDRCGATGNGHE